MMIGMSKSWTNTKWSAATIFMKLWDNRPQHLTIPVDVVKYRYHPLLEQNELDHNEPIKHYELGDVELLDLIEKLKPKMMRYGYWGTSVCHDSVCIEVYEGLLNWRTE